MRIDELKKRIKEEDLNQYTNIAIGRLDGFYVGAGIEKQDDASYTVSFTDERGAIISQWDNLTEEQACDMVYDYAAANQRIHIRRSGTRPSD